LRSIIGGVRVRVVGGEIRERREESGEKRVERGEKLE
jgi:hypothetical protein